MPVMNLKNIAFGTKKPSMNGCAKSSTTMLNGNGVVNGNGTKSLEEKVE